uniref:Uncharacterized protein n=1 Tax=Rhizophora mucronata TaxID=61149 RepID=A0A2P2IIV3_RHIMU
MEKLVDIISNVRFLYFIDVGPLHSSTKEMDIVIVGYINKQHKCTYTARKTRGDGGHRKI